MTSPSQKEVLRQSANTPLNSRHYEDEIDLLDIWRVLVAKRKIVISVTLVVTVLALAYALLAPRIYEAKTFILPPLKNGVEQLNIPYINEITVDEVYNEAIKNLQSLSLRQRFFNDSDLYGYFTSRRGIDGSKRKIFNDLFHERLLVQRGNRGREAFVSVVLSGEEPALIAAWLNDFISLVDAYTVKELVKTLETKIYLKKENIRNNIESLRNVANRERNDEIARLEEKDLIERKNLLGQIKAAREKADKDKDDRLALLRENILIAESLGIEEQTSLPFPGLNKTSSPSIGINTSNLPLYTRGTKALRSEVEVIKKRQTNDPFVKELRELEKQLALLKTNERVEVLRKRKNDDPFIGPLRGLQKRLRELEKIKIDVDRIGSFLVDQPAVVPEKSIKPKRKLVVAIGLALGLVLGLFCAFAYNFVENNRGKI